MPELTPQPKAATEKKGWFEWKTLSILLIILLLIVVFSIDSSQRLIVLATITIIGLLIYVYQTKRSQPDMFQIIDLVEDKIYKNWGAVCDSPHANARVEKRGVYWIVTLPIMLDNQSTGKRYIRSFKVNAVTNNMEGVTLESGFEFEEKVRGDTILQAQLQHGIFPGEVKNEE